MNKQAGTNYDIFNQSEKIENKEPFWGELQDMAPLVTKDLGISINYLTINRFRFYACLGTLTLGHKEYITGGKSDTYVWWFGSPPPNDTLFIKTKIYNYLFSAGTKLEYHITKNVFAEIQFNYCINGDNSNKEIKTFRSVYDIKASSRRAGTIKGENLPYIDVNHRGFIQGQVGLNTNINSRFKLHLLYLRTLTPHTKYFKGYYHSYYQGASLQLSYSFLNPNKGNDD